MTAWEYSLKKLQEAKEQGPEAFQAEKARQAAIVAAKQAETQANEAAAATAKFSNTGKTAQDATRSEMEAAQQALRGGGDTQLGAGIPSVKLPKDMGEWVKEFADDWSFARVGNELRQGVAGMDVSNALRQGWGSIRHGSEYLASLRDMRYGLTDEAYAIARNNEIMTGKFHHFGGFVGELPGQGAIGRDLKLLKTEENYAGDLVANLPGYKETGRANTLFLNSLRDRDFNVVDKAWQRAEDATRVPTRVNNFAQTGVAPPTTGQRISGALARPGDREALATFITRLTGRGTLGPLEGTWVDTVLGVGFFSPRYQASLVQGVANMFNWQHPRVAIEAWKDYGASFAATVTLLALANESGLADVELDPTSSKFGQFSVGEGTTIDPWAGFRPLAVLTARMISGHYQTGAPAADLDLLSDFVRGKLSPLVSSAVNVTGYWPGAEAGENNIGQPFGRKEMALSFLPMMASGLYDAAKEGLLGEALITMPAQMVGLGTNQYISEADKRGPTLNAAINDYFDSYDDAYRIARDRAPEGSVLKDYKNLDDFRDHAKEVYAENDVPVSQWDSSLAKLEQQLGITDLIRSAKMRAVRGDPGLVDYLEDSAREKKLTGEDAYGVPKWLREYAESVR